MPRKKEKRQRLTAEADALLRDYLYHPEAERMRQYIQHGTITTYDHALEVARRCYRRSQGRRVDTESLTVAAFLHDLYLYDWHEPDSSHRLHGFHHARRAADNARRIFGISDEIYAMIDSHMWPLNLTRLPRSREAWILTLTDKEVSLTETLSGFWHRVFPRRDT